jgi:TIR domain
MPIGSMCGGPAGRRPAARVWWCEIATFTLTGTEELPNGGESGGVNAGVSNDSGVPAFFLSYARQRSLKRSVSSSTANNDIRQFFTRLSEDVAQMLTPLPGQDPGFMDTTMQAGYDWNDEILWAAGSCQVFIAMLSPAYVFSSEWCAMEWDIFARRNVIPLDGAQPVNRTAILPVLWAPIADPLPPRVRAVQMFSPTSVGGATEALYRDHGVFGLIRMRRRNAYTTVVWTLAKQVVQTMRELRVETWVPDNTEGLRRTFLEEAV